MYFTTFYNYLKAYPMTDTCNAYYACLCVCVFDMLYVMIMKHLLVLFKL